MNTRTWRITMMAALALTGACGGSDEETPDAAAVDAAPAVDARPLDAGDPDAEEEGASLGCLGSAPVATAPDPMEVSGQLLAIVDYDVTPLAGATVTVRRRLNGAALTVETTGPDGRFAASVPTGGVALDVWFDVTAAGMLPTHAYPGEPLHGGESAFLLAATAAEQAAWYADAGVTYAPGDRTVIVAVKDCDGDSPTGVTLTAQPAPGVRTYYDPVGQRWDPAQPAADNGFVLLGKAADTFTATPSIGATALPPRAIDTAPDALTLVLATPRT